MRSAWRPRSTQRGREVTLRNGPRGFVLGLDRPAAFDAAHRLCAAAGVVVAALCVSAKRPSPLPVARKGPIASRHRTACVSRKRVLGTVDPIVARAGEGQVAYGESVTRSVGAGHLVRP